MTMSIAIMFPMIFIHVSCILAFKQRACDKMDTKSCTCILHMQHSFGETLDKIIKDFGHGYGTTNADAGLGIGMKRGIQKFDKTYIN